MFMRKTHDTTAWYDNLKREARHTAATHFRLTVVEGYLPSSYTTRCVSCVCFIVQRFSQIDSCRRLFAIIIYHTLCVLCMLRLSIVQRFVSLTVVEGYSPSSYTIRCVSCVCFIVQRCVSCVCCV
eukprot:XP_016656295.1 PREDICTED: uncharacterized protein LOC107882459 isoform X1 [Acyrthosiphon pisum]